MKHHCKSHTKETGENSDLIDIVKSINAQNASLQKEIQRLNQKVKSMMCENTPEGI
jgi:uncharacterized protein YlxW (UPF0749 family)